MIPLIMSIIAKTETFQRDMAKAGKQVFGFGKTTQGASSMIAGMNRQLLAMAGVGGGLYALKAGLTSSIKAFSNFEYGMAKVATMLDESTRKYLPQFGSEIQQMSIEYGTATEDMTEGLYKILSAQIDASKAMKVLRQSVESAKGGFASTADTVQATVRILNAYEMSIDKVNYVEELLHKTVRQGLMDFSDLSEHIGDAIGVTAPLGVDLEALAATLAVLTRTTQSTDKAVMSLRNILKQLKDPSIEQIKIARKLGFEMSEESIKGAGLIRMFEGLQKANAAQLDILMPTMRGFTGFATALKQAGAITKDYQFMLKDTNIAHENLNIALDTEKTRLDSAAKGWEEIRRVMGEMLAPVFDDLLSSWTKFSINFEAFAHANIATVYEYADAFTNLDQLFKKINPDKWPKTFKELAQMHRNMQYEALDKNVALERKKRIDDLMKKFPLPTQEDINRQIAEKRFVGPPKPSNIRVGNSQSKTQSELLRDEAKNYVKLYELIDARSKESYEWRIELIKREHDLAIISGEDKVRQEKLRDAELEELKRKHALDTQSPTQGIGSAIYELQQEIPTVAKIFHDVTKEINEGIVEGLNNAIWKTQEFGAAMKELGLSVAKMITQMLLQMAVTNAMMGIGGALHLPFLTPGKARSGGIVGQTNFPKTVVPAYVFAGAPKFRSGGTVGDEVPIIAHKGEEIIPAGGGNLGRKLDKMIAILSMRQTINANIIDKRDIVTKERMESREGEGWTLNHIKSNS